MNTDLRFDGIEIWQLAGWTMLHFLWLGTLVGLAAGACRVLLRQASPNVRYVTAITTLTLLASLPLAIAAWLVKTYPTDFLSEYAPAAVGFAVGPMATPTQISPSIDQNIGEIIELSGRNETPSSDKTPTTPDFARGLPTDGDLSSDRIDVQIAASMNSRLSRGLSDDASADTSPKPALVESLQSFALYLPWIWLVGTPITFALLATGLVGTRRLRLASWPIHDGPILELLAQLTTSLHVGKLVGLAVCDRIATPVLVGILRPIILLPPAALTGWSPDEIEMVLLHELAHVRRWDNLVNLAQRLVESLLFFHPVVWLVSNWIRREREACCDALVVDRTKRPHAYAELLVALAAELPRSVLFQRAASSAMAAGPLRNRIRRILQLEDNPMLISGKSFALVLGSLLVAATFAVLYLPAIGQAEDSNATSTKRTEEQSPADDEVLPDSIATKDEPTNEIEQATETLIADQLTLQAADGEVTVDTHGDQVELSFEFNAPSAEEEPASQQDTSTDEKVIATFPVNALTALPEEFFKAVDEARAKYGHIDAVYGDEGILLVKSTPPSEADWPGILGDPPRKDRVIAEKVWERLGLKLVPASDLESWDYHHRNMGGQVKILGGNVPKGLPLPAFLLRIGDERISHFDELLRWINSERGKGSEPQRVTALADGNLFLLDTVAAGNQSPPRSTPDSDVATSTRFPSLEDQKLADLAFKRLGLELELIDDEALKHVKTLGYDGGVKVVSGTAGIQGRAIQIEPGDILVGLHTWPTTNLKEVAYVLNRNDLAELSPLKFYVVRTTTAIDTGPTPMALSGRVAVNLPAGGFTAQQPAASQTPSAAPHAGDLTNYVVEAMADVGIDPKSGPVQVEMVPHEGGSALVVRGAAKTDPDIPRYVLPSAAEEDSHPKWPQADISGMTPRPPRSPQPQSAAAPSQPVTPPKSPSQPTASATNLRYEGKTFEEWRDASRIELSTERHLAAVQALAAFGANGYASDATEVILDVAGKYDFRIDVQRQSAESNLRSAIRRSFTMPRGIDPKIAFPMIMKRYNDAPEVWHGFVVYLLSWRVPLESKEMVELARPLLEHQDPEMRAAALEAIYRTNPGDSDEILATALRDASPQVVAKALEIVASNEDRNIDRQSEPTGLNLRHVDFPVEEFVAILVSFRPDGFNPNEGAVRQILTDLSPESADRVRNELLEIVNDPSRKDQHLYAIRAIGAIRRGRSSGADNPSIAILEKIVRESDDLTLRVAAAGAIGRIGGRSRLSLDHLSDELDDLTEDAPQRDQMRELIDAERRGNW